MSKSNSGFSKQPQFPSGWDKLPPCGGVGGFAAGGGQDTGRRRGGSPRVSTPSPKTIEEKYKRYEQLLLEWNQRMNLVGRGTLDDIRKRHIDDSAQLAEYIPKDKPVVDLGSGAGFPAAVLAILGYNVVAIEATGKKCLFLETLARELGLFNLKIVCGRAEKALFDGTLAGIFAKKPIITARGFAPLNRILEMCRKLDAPLVLLKGEKAMEEIAEARKTHGFDAETHPSKTGPGFVIKLTTI